MQLKTDYICRNQCRKYVCGVEVLNRWITVLLTILISAIGMVSDNELIIIERQR